MPRSYISRLLAIGLLAIPLHAESPRLRPLDIRLEAHTGAMPESGKVTYEYIGENGLKGKGTVDFDRKHPPRIQVPEHARIFVGVKDTTGNDTYADDWESVVITPTTKELTRQCQGLVSGEIVATRNGKPLEGATLHHVIRCIPGIMFESAPFARTDAWGIVALTGVPAGSSFLLAHEDAVAKLVSVNGDAIKGEGKMIRFRKTVELETSEPKSVKVFAANGALTPEGSMLRFNNRTQPVSPDGTVSTNPYFVGKIQILDKSGKVLGNQTRSLFYLGGLKGNIEPITPDIESTQDSSREEKSVERSRFSIQGDVPSNLRPCTISVFQSGYSYPNNKKTYESSPRNSVRRYTDIPEITLTAEGDGRFSIPLKEEDGGYWISIRPKGHDLGVTTLLEVSNITPKATLPDIPFPEYGEVTLTVTPSDSGQNKSAFRKLHFGAAPLDNEGKWFTEPGCLTTDHDGNLKNIRIPLAVTSVYTSDDYNRQMGCCIMARGTHIEMKRNALTKVIITH